MKRGTFKYYLITFLMVFVFMLVVMVISHARDAYLISTNIKVKGIWASEFTMFLYKDRTFELGKYLLDLLMLVVFPLIFTLVFVVIDLSMGRLRTKKNKEAIDSKEAYDKFIDEIGIELNKTRKFNVEDFRHFRSNVKFQNCLNTLYEIYKNGESENKSYILLLRKFDKGTKEKEAMEYLVTFTDRKRKQKLEKEFIDNMKEGEE